MKRGEDSRGNNNGKRLGNNRGISILSSRIFYIRHILCSKTETTHMPHRTEAPVNFDPTGNAHSSHPECEDAILSRLAALRAQERGPYKRADYLRRPALSSNCSDEDKLNLPQKTSSTDSLDTASTSSSLSSSSASSTLSDESLPIDAECRSVMIAWYAQVLDHCSFSRENGGIAAYILDMYLSASEGVAGEMATKALLDRREFQLVSMTALFLAIKMNECETITPVMVAKLSRGSFDALDVAHMETVLLRNLRWYVNPPTPLTFVHHYLELLRIGTTTSSGNNGQPSSRECNSTLRSVLKYAKIQIEQSSTDYFFVTIDPSLVAYAAILNAATCLGKRKVRPSTLIAFYQTLVDHKLISIKSSNHLSQVRDRLLRCVEGPAPQNVDDGGCSSDEEQASSSSSSEKEVSGENDAASPPGSPSGRKVANRSPGRKSPRSVANRTASTQ